MDRTVWFLECLFYSLISTYDYLHIIGLLKLLYSHEYGGTESPELSLIEKFNNISKQV